MDVVASNTNLIFGNESLDQEHGRLNDDLDIMVKATHLEPYNAATANQLALNLFDHLLDHFNHEEEWMIEIGFQFRKSHKMQHDNFTTVIRSIIGDLDADTTRKSATILSNFIQEWMVNHTIHADHLLHWQVKGSTL